MSIPKDAAKVRDEMAEKYGDHIVSNMHSLGTYKQADFKAGFDAGFMYQQDIIARLKAELWVAKDSQLRTYDGLAQRADKAEALEAECERLREQCKANIELAADMDSDLGKAFAERDKLKADFKILYTETDADRNEARRLFNIERTKVDRLRTALKSWLAWEEDQIRKEGPYVGKAINELITAGLVALTETE